MTPLRYHEAAGEELLNEIGYLELRGKGLGRRFFAEIRRAENLIARFPESAREIRPGIRKRILQKFRYSIIYSIEKEGLLVLAVAHHSRRPNYWVSRVGPGAKEAESGGRQVLKARPTFSEVLSARKAARKGGIQALPRHLENRNFSLDKY